MTDSTHTRGISNTIGIAILVAIVIVISTVTAVYVTEVRPSLSDETAFSDIQGETQIEPLSANDTQTVYFTHQGGENVDVSNLDIVFKTQDGSHRWRIDNLNSSGSGDGVWESSETLQIAVPDDKVCQGTNTQDIQASIVYVDDRQSRTMYSHTIPVREDGFVIDGGEVIPSSDYTANVTVLGSYFGDPSGTTRRGDIPVEFIVGDTVEGSWSNVNDGGNPRSAGTVEADAGTRLFVKSDNSLSYHYNVVGDLNSSSSSDSQYVKVLRDGDPTPTGFNASGQPSAVSYVKPYSENGKMTLDDNQAIFLFEFNTDSSGKDFNDAVVLTTLETEYLTNSEQPEEAFVCPP